MKTQIFFAVLACTGIIFGISGLTRKLVAAGKDKPAAAAPPAEDQARNR